MTQFGKTTTLEEWRRGSPRRTLLYTPHPHAQPGDVLRVEELMGPEKWSFAAGAKPDSIAWVVPHFGRSPKSVATGLIALLAGVERSGLPWDVQVEEAGIPGRDQRLGVVAARVSHFAGSTLSFALQRWKMIEPGTRDQMRRVYFYHYEDTEDLAELKKRRPRLDTDDLPNLAPGEWRYADSNGEVGRSLEVPRAIMLRKVL